MFDGGHAVLQAKADTFTQNVGKLRANFRRDVFADDISSEREGKSGFGFPPGSQVADEVKSIPRIGQLPLVNDQTGVHDPRPHGFKNLVERHYHMPEIRAEIKLRCQKSARHFSRNRNRFSAKPVPPRILIGQAYSLLIQGDKHRSIPVAHARSTGQRRILVEDVSKRMNRNRRDVKLPA